MNRVLITLTAGMLLVSMTGCHKIARKLGLSHDEKPAAPQATPLKK